MCVSYTPGLKLMVDINKLLLKLKYVKTRKNTHVQREREKYEVIKLYEKTNRQKTQNYALRIKENLPPCKYVCIHILLEIINLKLTKHTNSHRV